jgi:DNA polymerase elongation subunit (family B)
MNAALKLALNSSYGDSGNEYSPLYDPKYTMSITCSGQMLLTMLIEAVIEKCNAKVLMANTDGFEFMVDRSRMDEVKQCVSEWEELTQLTMEGDFYEVMYIRDVNSYIAIKEDISR